MARKFITVNGRRYPVLDDMGFQMGRSCWCVEAQTPDGPRIATLSSLRGSKWEWAAPAPIGHLSNVTGQ